LLLLNDATIPEDISTIPRVTVSTCIATKRAAGEFIEKEPVDEYGALCPTDSLNEQVLAELQPIADCRIYLDSTASDTFGSISGGNVEDKRVVKCQLTDSWLLIRSEVEDIGEHAHVFQVDNAEDPVPTAKLKYPVPGTGSKLGAYMVGLAMSGVDRCILFARALTLDFSIGSAVLLQDSIRKSFFCWRKLTMVS